MESHPSKNEGWGIRPFKEPSSVADVSLVSNASSTAAA
jgi:hypothetical protein